MIPETKVTDAKNDLGHWVGRPQLYILSRCPFVSALPGIGMTWTNYST